MSRRVALALGAGGARGYAHIGVLDELESRGYEVVAVAGTSMGALVGGVTAVGRLEDFSTWARSLTQRDVVRLIDPTWASAGVMAANRLLAEVDRLVEGALIEDLAIPFTAVATDLNAQREVWFQRGSLASAIRASIAIPGFITPVRMNGRLLADGGLVNPVPIEPTAAADADLTVAISLHGSRRRRGTAAPVRAAATTWRDELAGRLRRTVGRAAPEPDDPEQLEERLRVADVMSLSLDAMEGIIERYRMAAQPPDVLVTVPVGAARTLDFHRADEIVALGRTLGAQALDEWESREA